MSGHSDLSAKRQHEDLIETLYQIDLQCFQSESFDLRVHPDRVIILAHIHCLPSTRYIFQFLINEYGVKSSNILLMPKSYSTVPSALEQIARFGIGIVRNGGEVKPGHYDQSALAGLIEICRRGTEIAEKMARRGTRPRIVLLDDGGLLTERWINRHDGSLSNRDVDVVSVQQTASGVFRKPMTATIPKINIAYSAAKRKFESVIVAGGVRRKILESLNLSVATKVVGIAGYGAIGSALATKMRDYAHDVLVYDRVDIVTELEVVSQRDLLKRADVIFGCTGKNWLSLDAFDKSKGPKEYISCSSRDVEFQRVLQHRFDRYLDNREFGRIRLQSPKHQIVENGGFPINFDRNTEWERPSEIALTRALMLAGILQAMCLPMPNRKEWNIQLSPKVQMDLVCRWLAICDRTSEEFGISTADAHSARWWEKGSLGASVR
jgi:hypothetical protein